MWYVITPEGEREQVHNKETAIYFAKKYGTEYVDGWSNRVFKVGA
jgi:hypothetical protein